MTFLDLMELQPGVSPALISKTVTNVLRLEMANEEMLPLLHSLIDGLTDEIVQSGKGSSLILCSLLETRAREGNILLLKKYKEGIVNKIHLDSGSKNLLICGSLESLESNQSFVRKSFLKSWAVQKLYCTILQFLTN